MSLFISLQFSEAEIKDWAWRIPFILGGIFWFCSVVPAELPERNTGI